VKADSTAEKTLHRRLEVGCRGNPYLIGQLNDRFTLARIKEMQKDHARALMLEKSIPQLD
jgi:hypothetical protein